MTFEEARWKRFVYLVLSVLAFIPGLLIFAVTFLKILYALAGASNLFSRPIRGIISLLYYDVPVVRSAVQWLWPSMSSVGSEEPLEMLFNPTIIAGFALVTVGGFLLQNAQRLGTWMREVKDLLAKEQMRASLKPPSNRQSTGSIKAGRDVSLNQQITNHYNQRPDNPKYAIIAAIIAAVAAIIAALLGKGH